MSDATLFAGGERRSARRVLYGRSQWRIGEGLLGVSQRRVRHVLCCRSRSNHVRCTCFFSFHDGLIACCCRCRCAHVCNLIGSTFVLPAASASSCCCRVSDLLAAAGDDAPYDNPGYGLMQENSNGQVRSLFGVLSEQNWEMPTCNL